MVQLLSTTIPFTNQKLSLDTKNILLNLTNATLALGVLASIIYMAPDVEAVPTHCGRRSFENLKKCDDPKNFQNLNPDQNFILLHFCQHIKNKFNPR
jgi:hypothetical protein